MGKAVFQVHGVADRILVIVSFFNRPSIIPLYLKDSPMIAPTFTDAANSLDFFEVSTANHIGLRCHHYRLRLSFFFFNLSFISLV